MVNGKEAEHVSGSYLLKGFVLGVCRSSRFLWGLFVSQSQAASQEALDQIKAVNEANLRSQFEQKLREMESELGRARTCHQDSLSQRDSTRMELERFRQLYTEEMRLRKSLAAKLER